MAERWRPYVIRQGDYLAKLAHAMGFDAAEVWAHPRNASLRERRPNPEVLAPGDVLFVPTAGARAFELRVGGTNRVRAEVPKTSVVLRLRAHDGAAQANVRYWLYGLGDVVEGTTDAQGRITIAAPVDVPQVSLVLANDDRVHHLRIGHLDPVDEASGARQRLAHLGFFEERGDEDALDVARLAEAVARFQRTMGLDPTGELDDATREALRDEHGA